MKPEFRYRTDLLKIKIDLVINHTCRYFSISNITYVENGKRKKISKKPSHARCRDIIAYISFFYYNYSQPQIAEKLGISRTSTIDCLTRAEGDMITKEYAKHVALIKKMVDDEWEEMLLKRIDDIFM